MQTNPLSDVSSSKKRERMPKVSFAGDIRPLFRAVDISHTKAHGIKLDDYTFMSNPDNANKVLATLSPHDDHHPSLPTRRALLDTRSARVVRPMAEGRIPALSLINGC
jgi:hypothetical protein